MELIVWLNNADKPIGFELCYDKQDAEHAITWHSTAGFRHTAVDDGEGRPGQYKSSPLLLANRVFDAKRVYNLFSASSDTMPSDIAVFVQRVLATHPHFEAHDTTYPS
jgi:hypothetical protein